MSIETLVKDLTASIKELTETLKSTSTTDASTSKSETAQSAQATPPASTSTASPKKPTKAQIKKKRDELTALAKEKINEKMIAPSQIREITQQLNKSTIAELETMEDCENWEKLFNDKIQEIQAEKETKEDGDESF